MRVGWCNKSDGPPAAGPPFRVESLLMLPHPCRPVFEKRRGRPPPRPVLRARVGFSTDWGLPHSLLPIGCHDEEGVSPTRHRLSPRKVEQQMPRSARHDTRRVTTGRCPRFASRFWALTWAEEDSRISSGHYLFAISGRYPIAPRMGVNTIPGPWIQAKALCTRIGLRVFVSGILGAKIE